MTLCLALVRIENGPKLVLRGREKDVRAAYQKLMEKSAFGQILCFVRGEVAGEKEESALWKELTRKSEGHREAEFANAARIAWAISSKKVRELDLCSQFPRLCSVTDNSFSIWEEGQFAA